MQKYLPDYQFVKLPAVYERHIDEKTFNNEREILYKILFDMKNDVQDLKQLVLEIMQKGTSGTEVNENNAQIIQKLYQSVNGMKGEPAKTFNIHGAERDGSEETEEIIEESLAL